MFNLLSFFARLSCLCSPAWSPLLAGTMCDRTLSNLMAPVMGNVHLATLSWKQGIGVKVLGENLKNLKSQKPNSYLYWSQSEYGFWFQFDQNGKKMLLLLNILYYEEWDIHKLCIVPNADLYLLALILFSSLDEIPLSLMDTHQKLGFVSAVLINLNPEICNSTQRSPALHLYSLA